MTKNLYTFASMWRTKTSCFKFVTDFYILFNLFLTHQYTSSIKITYLVQFPNFFVLNFLSQKETFILFLSSLFIVKSAKSLFIVKSFYPFSKFFESKRTLWKNLKFCHFPGFICMIFCSFQKYNNILLNIYENWIQ